jgi:hypothetical protein
LLTAEELDQVRAYDGGRLLLGTAETFVAVMAEIPLFPEHIEFMLLARTFDQQMRAIERTVNIILSGLTALRTSRRWMGFLTVVLRIGNILNGGSPRGGAYGFKWEFVDKIRDVGTQRPGYTLVHCTADHFPVGELCAEIDCVRKIVRVDLETARKDYAAIELTFNNLDKSMPKAEKLVMDPEAPSRLYPAFMKFKETVDERLAAPAAQFADIDKMYPEIVRSWGEDPNQAAIADVVRVVIRLLDALTDARAALDKRKAAEERARARANRSETEAVGQHQREPRGPCQRGGLDELKIALQGPMIPMGRPTQPVRPAGAD